MATSSFDKEFIITNPKAVEQLINMMENGTPTKHKIDKSKDRELDVEKVKKMLKL